jgi:hypothetical protein
MRSKRIIIYSYIKVWKVEKKLYSFQNLKFPFPVEPKLVGYMIGTWIFCFILSKIIPGLNWIPGVIRLGVCPYGLAKFLMTQKLDGKNPLSYIRDLILYLILEQGTVVEHFRKIPEKEGTIRLNWNCSEGYNLEGR